MQITPKQQEVIMRIANDDDGAVLVSFFKAINRHYADVRNLPEPTKEAIIARQLLCTILEEEVINRLSRKDDNTITNNDDYD